MVQPIFKLPQSHLPRYLVAGGIAVVALWWGLSFVGPASSSSPGMSTAASDPASVAEGSQAPGSEGNGTAQSDQAQKPSASSAAGFVPALDGTHQPPSAQVPNTVSVGSSPTPALLSNGSSLEDQLQAQRSAELHDFYPVEDSPSGASAKPPAAPGVANPHQ